MFTLLRPAALLALSGLLVPVAIHLWNRRPGREVAVGSLRWLAAGANRRLRNLKPEQLWLLLLRAALLAVLAVAVAGPVWRTAQPISRGVVLLSAEAARLPALAGLKPTIDSLRRKGYVLRWLAAGFPRVPGGTWRAVAAGRPNATADSAAPRLPTGPAWARVQQATATFPGQPLFVVTSTALRNFQGSRAPLPAAVRWQMLPDTTTSTWLAAAARVGDSLQLLVGRSNETQTTYRRRNVRQPSDTQPFRVPGLAPMRLRPAKQGGTSLILIPVAAHQPLAEIDVAVTPTLIELYASPEYAVDARYLEAALRAAAVGMPVPPKLLRTKLRPTHLKADWTFWLSAEPLPQNWQQDADKNAQRLWLEATGPGVADTAHFATTEPAAVPATVFRRDARRPAPGNAIVWADGRGRAILSRQALGRGSLYQLHTRLHPTWSELADDSQLPARLLELLQPEPNGNAARQQPPLAQREAAHDRRALAPTQLPTSAGPATGPTGQKTALPDAFRQTDLRPWLVLLAGLLLLLERLLAYRRSRLLTAASNL